MQPQPKNRLRLWSGFWQMCALAAAGAWPLQANLIHAKAGI
jgi:hypothetical protein